MEARSYVKEVHNIMEIAKRQTVQFNWIFLFSCGIIYLGPMHRSNLCVSPVLFSEILIQASVNFLRSFLSWMTRTLFIIHHFFFMILFINLFIFILFYIYIFFMFCDL